MTCRALQSYTFEHCPLKVSDHHPGQYWRQLEWLLSQIALCHRVPAEERKKPSTVFCISQVCEQKDSRKPSVWPQCLFWASSLDNLQELRRYSFTRASSLIRRAIITPKSKVVGYCNCTVILQNVLVAYAKRDSLHRRMIRKSDTHLPFKKSTTCHCIADFNWLSTFSIEKKIHYSVCIIVLAMLSIGHSVHQSNTRLASSLPERAVPAQLEDTGSQHYSWASDKHLLPVCLTPLLYQCQDPKLLELA